MDANERGVCPSCDTLVAVADLIAVPGPGLPHIDADADPVTAALARPHRMLGAVDSRAAHRRPRGPQQLNQREHRPVDRIYDNDGKSDG
jgi:hypothetical protein